MKNMLHVVVVILIITTVNLSIDFTEISAEDHLHQNPLYCPEDCECIERTKAVCHTIKGIGELPKHLIKELTISGNCEQTSDCMHRFEKGLLANFTKLESLYIYNTAVQTLPDGFFDSARNIKVLHLHRNPMVFTRNSTVFLSLKNLTYLSIQFSQNVFLDESLFYGLKNLQRLDLRNNPLRCFPQTIFQYLPSMTELRLSNNKLKSFTYNGAMNASGNLEYIFLDNNNIQTLQMDSFDETGNLKELHLNNNQLSCSCTLYGLVLKLIQSNVYTKGTCTAFDEFHNTTVEYPLTYLSDSLECSGFFGCKDKQLQRYQSWLH